MLQLLEQLADGRQADPRALGDFDACIAIWEDVLPVYQRIGEVDVAAKLCWEMGYQLIWLNRFSEAFAAYARTMGISCNRARGLASRSRTGA